MKHLVLPAIFALLTGCATQPQKSSVPFTERTTARVERPGLGTGSGEWRASVAAPAYFARAWADRPGGTAKLFYNDREGVNAMLAYLGGEPRPSGGLQKCADGLVQIGLRDGSGRWLDAWELRGHRIAVGEHGSRYEIVVKNESRRRVEVVLSVDGLDVIEGRPAAFTSRGYVIGPRETIAVPGFRAGREGVAAFRFVAVGDTLAQRRHAETRNVGLIGVAVFTERWTGTPAVPRASDRAWRLDGSGAAHRPDA